MDYLGVFFRDVYAVESFEDLPECKYSDVEEQIQLHGACRVPQYDTTKDTDNCVFGANKGDSYCEKDLCWYVGSSGVSGPEFGGGTTCHSSLILRLKILQYNNYQWRTEVRYYRWFYNLYANQADWIMWPLPTLAHGRNSDSLQTAHRCGRHL